MQNDAENIFIDTTVPMYAGGETSTFKSACQHVLKQCARGTILGVTDAEVFQEILYRYDNINEKTKGQKIFDHFYNILKGNILPITQNTIKKARNLQEKYKRLNPRDLIHLSVMEEREIKKIITVDKDFDQLDHVKRLTPQSFSSS